MKRCLAFMVAMTFLIGVILFSTQFDLTANAASSKVIKLTYYSTSAEVNTMFEKMFKRFHELNPNIVVELIPIGVGEGQLEKLQSLYASGNAPSAANIDAGVARLFKDKLLEFDPKTDKWLSLIEKDALYAGMDNGKIIGIPFSVQGYGLLYNKRVVEKAIGGKFDPYSIRTRNDLENLFKKIEKIGVAPTLIHGANWSLGAHYLGLVYSAQSRKMEDGMKFIEDLKKGKVKLIENKIFNGYMDTFDLLKKYNLRKKDPLVADYFKDVQDFAQGKCATFFMGDWAWTVMNTIKNKDKEFGLIPVPWSNNPNDYGNTQIAYSAPKVQVIDKSQNSVEKQKAAKKLLEWMHATKEGQKFYHDAGFLMPYKNFDKTGLNPLVSSTAEYVKKGLVLNIGAYVYNPLPLDFWEKTGASMQKYLAGKIDRKQLAKEIEDYWKSKANK